MTTPSIETREPAYGELPPVVCCTSIGDRIGFDTGGAPARSAGSSATAVAKTSCRVIALDDDQFRKGLEKKPAFALMLMSIMIGRLRETIARLAEQTTLKGDSVVKESVVFDAKRLAELAEGLSADVPVYFDRGKTIVEEGQPGLRMYAVMAGRVAVSIGSPVNDSLRTA